MNIRTCMQIMTVLFLAAFTGGCGSGGNGTPGTATVTKSVSLSATNPLVKGIDFTLILPDGVTVATNTDGTIASGVVTIPTNSANVGTASIQAVKYTPASAGVKGAVRIGILLNNPQLDSFVSDDHFFTIACVVDAGLSVPAASAFDYKLLLYDADGADITSSLGATATITL